MHRLLSLGAFLLLTAVGCSRNEEVSLTQDGANSASSGQWTIQTSVGADGQLVAEVIPAAGYKINTEFPWRLTVAEETKRVDDAETFNEQRARFTASKPESEGEVTGELRFSVCNASTCLTPRETVRWTN